LEVSSVASEWAHLWGSRRAYGTLRRWRALAGAFVLALALILLSGCQISQDAVKRDPFLQELVTAQSAAQADAAPHRLGEPFQVGNTQWTIQDASATYALRLGNTTLQAVGEFVVVRFAFQNLSTATQPPQPDMLTLAAGKGGSARTFLPDKRTTALYAQYVHQPNFLTITALVKHPYALTVIFDVLRSSADLALQFHSYPDQNQVDAGI
jgi:hypothetical protein